MNVETGNAKRKCPVFLGIICTLGFVGAILKLPAYFFIITANLSPHMLGTLIMLVDAVFLNSILIATFVRLRQGLPRPWKGIQVLWGIYMVLGFVPALGANPIAYLIPISQVIVLGATMAYIRSAAVRAYCGVPTKSA